MSYRINILDAPEPDADAAESTLCAAEARDVVAPPEPAPAGVRPERGIATALSVLLRDGEPESWPESLAASLERLGLGGRITLCRRVDDRLRIVGSDHGLPACGWMGSILAATDVLLERDELSCDDLDDDESAYLESCAADLHLPLVDGGVLVGLLSLATSSGEGLSGLISAEVAALECLGRIVAERLARDVDIAAPTAADEIIDIPVPSPAC